MATTRLRKTFNYPSSSSDEDAVEEGMDSQDQADLLTNFSTKDTRSTTLYTRVLLAFPLLPILLYIPQLFKMSAILPSALAIASLLATAYTLYYLPLPPVRVKVTTVDTNPGASRRSKTTATTKPKRLPIARSATGFSSTPVLHETPEVPYLSDETAGLLRTYLIPSNIALCAIFAVGELWQGRSWGEGVMIGGGYLPGLVLGVVMWARRELRVMDLGELERLRYRGKGT